MANELYDTSTDEKNDDYSNDDLSKINSWGADLSFREIIARYKDDELIKPEIQRKYVWDRAEASRFIETLLYGLPVPSIFLAKTPDEKYLIIDGYQRIMSVCDFVEGEGIGEFSKKNKPFKLSNTEKINEKWRGKAFSDLLAEEQRRIKNTTIHAIIFEQKNPNDKKDTSLYQIFERINTGGRTLLPQEIRNCIYQGKLNKLIIDLNKDKNWRYLLGLEKEDERMRDIELVLRLLAYTFGEYSKEEKTKLSLKKYLNDFMGNKDNNSNKRISEFENAFKKITEFCKINFGENAFRNYSIKQKEYSDRIYPPILDAVCVATYKFIFENKGKKKITDKELKNKHIQMFSDKSFLNSISGATTDIVNIDTRINKAFSLLFK